MIVGISTFLVVLESSRHRIACEFSEEWAHRYLLVSQSEPANRPRGCRIPASPLCEQGEPQLKPASPLLAHAEPHLKPPSPLLAFMCVGLKPLSPFRDRARVGLKPPSPLRVRNGCFWRVFGRRGVVGFNGCCSGASSGDGGFTVAECCALCAKKVRPACSKWPKMGVLWRAGRVFSRVSARGPFVGRSFSWSCCGTGMSGDLCRGAEPTGAQWLGSAA